MTSLKKLWRPFDFFMELLVFLVPLVTLVRFFSIVTISTQSPWYRDNPVTLTDPGHKKIRIYDRLIKWVAGAMLLYVFAIFLATIGSTEFPRNEFHIFQVIVFPQLATGWGTALLWYALYAFLRIYQSKRDSIIRTTNEKAGAW